MSIVMLGGASSCAARTRERLKDSLRRLPANPRMRRFLPAAMASVLTLAGEHTQLRSARERPESPVGTSGRIVQQRPQEPERKADGKACERAEDGNQRCGEVDQKPQPIGASHPRQGRLVAG